MRFVAKNGIDARLKLDVLRLCKVGDVLGIDNSVFRLAALGNSECGENFTCEIKLRGKIKARIFGIVIDHREKIIDRIGKDRVARGGDDYAFILNADRISDLVADRGKSLHRSLAVCRTDEYFKRTILGLFPVLGYRDLAAEKLGESVFQLDRGAFCICSRLHGSDNCVILRQLKGIALGNARGSCRFRRCALFGGDVRASLLRASVKERAEHHDREYQR